MECPKCGYIIDENTLVCPNCKKVLKLICPKCKTLNKSNTCRTCGFTIVTKCYQCGKVNPTINGYCSKCGFSTYVSEVLNDSNIEEFACLTFDFPNLDAIKKNLKSKKMYDKFKSKMDKFIKNYFVPLHLKPQIIDGTYVVRFNKDYTFKRSVKNALASAVNVLNALLKTNQKLMISRNIHLNCNVAIFKRDVSSTNDNYKSGINIQLLYHNLEKGTYLNGLQVIVDQNIYEYAREDYVFSALGSTIIKNTSMMLFELDLANHLTQPEPEVVEEEKESDAEFEMPEFMNYNDEELEEELDLYNIEGINFDEKLCSFKKVNSKQLIPFVVRELSVESKNIVAIKSARPLLPATQTFLSQIKAQNKYKKVYSITCTDLMKSTPYGFFKELISIVYNYTLSTTDFSSISILDEFGYIKQLMTMSEISDKKPSSEVRNCFFQTFAKLLLSLKNSLIYVEDFDKIDKTSFEFLREVFEDYDKYSVSFLLVTDNKFSLHQYAKKLLLNPYYTEISVKQSPFSEFFEPNKELFKSLLNTFYLKKIAEHTQGSPLYFMLSTMYLVDSGVLKMEKNSFEVIKDDSKVLPVSLDELIQKRLIFLAQDEKAYELLAKFLFIGPRIDMTLLKLFEFSIYPNELKKLESMGYIYFEGYDLYIQNYNLYIDNLLKIMPIENQKIIAKEVLGKMFLSEQVSPLKASLYSTLEDLNKAFNSSLSVIKLSLNLGDFYAYLNGGTTLIEALNLTYDESENEFLEKNRIAFFDNVIKYLYDYNVKDSYTIVNAIIKYLELTLQDEKLIGFCKILLESSISDGNYSEALIFTYKILSKMSSVVLDVNNPKFSKEAYFVSLLKTEVLFALGSFEECYSLGLELFSQLELVEFSKIKENSVSMEIFKNKVEKMFQFTVLSGVLLLKNDVEDFINKATSFLNLNSQNTEIFLMLNKFVHGHTFSPELNMLDEENLLGAIFLLLKALSVKDKDLNEFAQRLYKMKILARKEKLELVERLANLLIGYVYFKSGILGKALKIYKDVLEKSIEQGMNGLVYLAWLLLAKLNIAESKFDVASGLVTNAIIQLEKDSKSSEWILMHFKLLLAEILKLNKNEKDASFCYNQAKIIAEKYEIQLEDKEK